MPIEVISISARGPCPDFFRAPTSSTAATVTVPSRGWPGQARPRGFLEKVRRATALLLALLCVVLSASPAEAYRLLVSNEKDNTVTVVAGDTLEIVKIIPVGSRPRGLALSADGKQAYLCASDANRIEVLDLAALSVAGTLPSGKDPENFALSPDGKTLYIANEDDNLVTVVDVPTAKVTAEIPTGVEPEGMAVSPDGKIVVNTSETTSMAHFIDAEAKKAVANVLVGSRPRFAAFTGDGKQVWVSSEVGGTVAVIDAATHKILRTIEFAVPGVRRETIQPVGIALSRDGRLAFVALGPANRVAVIDRKSFDVVKYLLVGQRVWHMDFSPDQTLLYTANGISNDMSVIDVAGLKVTKSVPVGHLPWAVLAVP